MAISAVAGISVKEGDTSINKTIGPGITMEIVSLKLSDITSIRWDIYLKSLNNIQSFSLTLLNKIIDVEETISNVIGDDINFNYSFTIINNYLNFKITNNESFDLIFKAKQYM